MIDINGGTQIKNISYFWYEIIKEYNKNIDIKKVGGVVEKKKNARIKCQKISFSSSNLRARK